MNVKGILTLALGLAATCPLFAANPSLELTSSIPIYYPPGVGGFPFTPSLSQDGSGAYVTYTINASSTSQVISQIFQNSSGTLVPGNFLSYDGSAFYVVDNGYANPSFTRFSLVDDNNLSAGSGGAIRIRIFDNTLTAPLASRIIPGYDGGSGTAATNDAFSGNGGQFSPDGKYVLLSYLTDATPGSLTSALRVLDANTLVDVAVTSFSGGSFGGNFFTLKGKTYVAITAYNGTFEFSFDRDGAVAPSQLFVYQLAGSSLNLVDTANLPQAADAPTVFVKSGKAFIGVGTARAVLNNEITIFEDNSTKGSFLANDGNEQRIYAFNSKKLKLAFSRNPNVTNFSPAFSPNGKFLVWDEQAIDASPGILSLFTINKLDDVVLCAPSTPYISAPFYAATFSGSGKWFLVTGSDQDTGTNQSDPDSQVNSVNLYKVVK